MEKSRNELYELVWAKPMTHLSKELGLSDVGLRKIYVKFGIPLPSRGRCHTKVAQRFAKSLLFRLFGSAVGKK